MSSQDLTIIKGIYIKGYKRETYRDPSYFYLVNPETKQARLLYYYHQISISGQKLTINASKNSDGTYMYVNEAAERSPISVGESLHNISRILVMGSGILNSQHNRVLPSKKIPYNVVFLQDCAQALISSFEDAVREGLCSQEQADHTTKLAQDIKDILQKNLDNHAKEQKKYEELTAGEKIKQRLTGKGPRPLSYFTSISCTPVNQRAKALSTTCLNINKAEKAAPTTK